MRSRALWIRSVPGLADQHVITLINNQNPAISPGNMKPSEWKRVSRRALSPERDLIRHAITRSASNVTSLRLQRSSGTYGGTVC